MVSIVSVWKYDQYYMDAICIEIYIYFMWVNPWCVNFIHTLLSTCDEPLDISEQYSIQAFILHLKGIIKLKIMLFAQKKRHAKNTWHCMYLLFPKLFDFSCNIFFYSSEVRCSRVSDFGIEKIQQYVVMCCVAIFLIQLTLCDHDWVYTT